MVDFRETKEFVTGEAAWEIVSAWNQVQKEICKREGDKVFLGNRVFNIHQMEVAQEIKPDEILDSLGHVRDVTIIHLTVNGMTGDDSLQMFVNRIAGQYLKFMVYE